MPHVYLSKPKETLIYFSPFPRKKMILKVPHCHITVVHSDLGVKYYTTLDRECCNNKR